MIGEKCKKKILKDLPVLPKIITNEWLIDSLKNDEFECWGFSLFDLSNTFFSEDIDINLLKKISFSTITKFGNITNKYVFELSEKNYSPGEEIAELHKNGITGYGINVAVIDYGFEIISDEIKDNLFDYHKSPKKNYDPFHGSCVSAIFVGKKIGIAPEFKLYFYENGGTGVEAIADRIEALKDIYKKNCEGANIRIVNLSSSSHRENETFLELSKKLRDQGCYVIDSQTFGDIFTCVNEIDDEICYSDWQLERNKNGFFDNKIGVITGGKAVPLVESEKEYQYCAQASYSWAIPKICGMFALALQVSPNLTYDNFVEFAKETAIKRNNVLVIRIDKIMQKVFDSNILTANKKI